MSGQTPRAPTCERRPSIDVERRQFSSAEVARLQKLEDKVSRGYVNMRLNGSPARFVMAPPRAKRVAAASASDSSSNSPVAASVDVTALPDTTKSSNARRRRGRSVVLQQFRQFLVSR
eukprot:TRINITY_DN70127_c0_g1_i1.p1 TRINITY_DN70127_c0_g1~~TRINITY_DN70127_c0_g1_i1.p1  ORF type:complete len:118 (-),score=11.94 TRINITY_DN70127_c0_g1_i1:93-446(-)